jgi:RHS repeat-associated protein
MIDCTGAQPVWYYYHYDGCGNVVALSNTNTPPQIVEAYRYDHFGTPTVMVGPGNDGNWATYADNPTATASQLGNPYLFTGRQYDPETGLYYYRARYYNATIGRFLQTDPIGYAGGLNLYTYCGNNASNWADPYGLCKSKHPGFWTSLIPVYGSGMESIAYYSEGRWVVGTLYAGLAVTDVFGVKILVEDGLKLAFKGTAELLGREAVAEVGEAAAKGAAEEAAEVAARETAESEAERYVSKIDRKVADADREAYWKAEAKNNPEKYASEDLAKMEKGRAPTGADGKPVELHHNDGTPEGGVTPMDRTDHRGGDNYKKNHPWLE